MVVCLFAALAIAGGLILLLAREVRTLSTRLQRTRGRMERLEAFAEEAAERAMDEPRAGGRVGVEHDEVPATADVPYQPHTPPPPAFTSRHESGEFTPVGLQFDTEDALAEDDFVPPTMKPTPKRKRMPTQQAFRQRHETPVGSPRALTPQPAFTLMNVGSISIRSDRVSQTPQAE